MLCSPGKAAPPAPATPLKAKRPSTFQEFESSTSDAWDAGEDEDELLAMAAESLNTEVVMETAHRVLRNHSQRQERPPPREAPQPRAEPALAPAPGGDLRLVKSVSESHTPCPAGGTGPRGDVLFCGREGPESLAVGGGPSRWRREPRLGKMVAARAPSALLFSVLRAKRPVVRGRSEHTFSGTLPPRSTPWLSGATCAAGATSSATSRGSCRDVCVAQGAWGGSGVGAVP